MPKSKLTPGPLDYDMSGCPISHGLPVITKANGHLIAHLAEKNEANARAISELPILIEALRKIANMAPDVEPEEEDYDDTESAFGNGYDCASWEAAKIANSALHLLTLRRNK